MTDRSDLSRFLGSTSIRLSLRFALLYALVSAIVFLATYFWANYEITDWVTEQLSEEARGFTQLYQADGIDAVVSALDGFGSFNFENYRIYLLQDDQGQVLTSNVARIDWDGQGSYVPADAVGFAKPYDIEDAGYLLHTSSLGQNRLILGTSTYFLTELREGLGGGLIIGFVLLSLSGLAAGIAIGRQTERRLSEISGTLKSVAAGVLEVRVPVKDNEAGDLSMVAREINRTIAQLQRIVESQKQISADIAHDLRTPMQRLRQRLETIGQSRELPEHLAEDIDGAIDAVDDLIETFHALLRIAQIEAGERRERFTEVSLAAVIARIEDAYVAVAEENGQSLTFDRDDGDISVKGDQHLLTQMMANIVENALRHCPRGAQIKVSLRNTARGIVFEVADNGGGIAEAEREKIFRRFYRLEKSRTTPGNGLGLSLVKAVADLHDAVCALQDNNPGLRFTVTFPPPPGI